MPAHHAPFVWGDLNHAAGTASSCLMGPDPDGTGRSAAGLGNKMREWCNAANLPQCSAHGLRKACARRLAEAGATAHEIMSITGHKTLAEAQRYTKAALREGMADSAMEKLLSRPNQKQTVVNLQARFAENYANHMKEK